VRCVLGGECERENKSERENERIFLRHWEGIFQKKINFPSQKNFSKAFMNFFIKFSNKNDHPLNGMRKNWQTCEKRK
jgi:hypothetical protein